MTIRKIAQVIGTGAAIALFSFSAQAALLNPSFESPNAAGGDIAGSTSWGSFNNTYTSSNLFGPPVFFVNPGAHSGTQVIKQYGVDAGIFQDVAAAPGDTVDASAYAISWAGDAFNNVGLLQIFALDAGGSNLSGGFNPLAQVVAAAPAVGGTPDYVLSAQIGDDPGQWTLMQVSAIMPALTASVRIQMIHILEASTPNNGALFWDDASLTVTAIPVPAAVWLFGSGLLGLVGVARRKKS